METFSICTVLFPYAHFLCPIQKVAFSISCYQTVHDILFGRVYCVSDRENKMEINTTSSSSFMARGKFLSVLA